MSGPPPATAAARVAVRRCLADLDPATPVVAAVSGGADSLALAAALAFERPGSGALVVDHALQDGSADVAAKAAGQCSSLGLEARVLTAPAGAGRGGPEAAARALRYALLEQAAGDAVVLLAHTREDQAETVLLGLLRGSGARALAGMAPVRGRYRRPFLDLARATVRQACAEAGLAPYEDPHNDDDRFRRTVVRRLLAELDVSAALARTARLLREDADALDALARPTDDVAELMRQLPAVRARSLKRWGEERAGRPLTAAHVEALRALVEDWHGQGPVALPGGSCVSREAGRLAWAP